MEVQTFNKLSKFEIITNKRIIDAVINTIYDHLNVSMFGYKMIDANNCLPSLDLLIKNHQDYLVTPHIMGINSWMIFLEFEGKYIGACINKKDTKHFKKQIDYNSLKIYNFNFRVNPHHVKNKLDAQIKDKLFPFSIFDGKFIVGIDNILSYNIFDIYYMAGKSYLNVTLKDKMILIKEMIGTMNDVIDTTKNEFNIKMIGLYEIEQLADLTFNKIKQSKLKINGFVFLPLLSGKTMIYINDSDFANLRQHMSEPITTDNYKYLNVPAIPYHMRVETQQDSDFKNKFVLKKTKVADVFEVYNCLPQYTNKLYLNIYDQNRIGVAHIPDIKTSKYCKNKGNQHEIFVNECIYNNKFNKWQPVL